MRTLAIDRAAAILFGLLLLAGGAAVIDWRFDLVGVWTRLDADRIAATFDEPWFPWAAGGVAIVLGALALWWLLARIPRPVEGRVPLGSDGADRIEVDVKSIAPRLREQLERSAPVDHVTSGRIVTGTGQLVELRAHVDPRADGESLVKAAEHLAATVAEAFPDGQVTVRTLIDAPRRPGSRKTPRVH